MEYRSLGRTGVQVSMLCLGGGNFGKPRVGPKASAAIVDRAIDAGINFIDTANSYADGRSETLIGRALKQNGKRSRIVLASKFSNLVDPTDPNGRGVSRRHIVASCEDSLRRLQTDHLDLYYIHKPHANVPVDETLRALDDLVRSGKVRYIGSSSFYGWEVMESLWVSKELGLNRVVAEQPPYNMLDRSIEQDVLPLAQSYGLAVNPWSPTARGFLIGAFKRGQRLDRDSMSKVTWAGRPWWNELHGSDEVFDLVDLLEKIAAEKDCSLAQLVLAWTARQPGITSPIMGPRSLAHLKDNLGAVDVEITDDDRRRVDAATSYDGDGAAIRVLAPYRMRRMQAHPFRW